MKDEDIYTDVGDMDANDLIQFAYQISTGMVHNSSSCALLVVVVIIMDYFVVWILIIIKFNFVSVIFSGIFVKHQRRSS